jgi:hypothetical protein
MSMVVHEYELFVMKKDENISEMSTRFTNIVNCLKSLGKIYTNEENVRKILRSLPKRWEAKKTAIYEDRDLKVLSLDELFGSLMTYELEMNSKVEEEEVKPKKKFTLKSFYHDHDNSEEESDEEEKIALMTRMFKKFLKKKKGFGRRFPKKGENSGESSKNESPICYKCKKPGHYKNECPQVDKENMKYKKKALKATWDDSNGSDSDNDSSDNEIANLCLLGYINKSDTSQDEYASFCPLAFNDDESATEDLCLMAHGDEVCLISKSTKDKWFLDSRCSRHMTGDKNKFTSLALKDGGNVKFGDNSKGKIIGVGNIGKTYSLVIEDVLLVDGLKHNLLSSSQLCDKGYNVIFKSIMCIIVNEVNNQVLFVEFRNENDYTIDLDNLSSNELICLAAINENSWLWQRRLGHANMELLSKLSKLDLVKGFPITKFVKDKICDASQLGKQTKSFKKKKVISTSRPIELLHMDLFGPIRTASLSGKLYVFVIVDDYSRYTWVLFLAHKNEAQKAFVKLCRRVQNEKGYAINNVRSDRGREFDNQDIELYCDQNGFGHNFSAPRTPQQNSVVESKNRSFQEMSRTMLNEHNLPQYFWAEGVNTACYVINRTIIRNTLNKTPYELWKYRKPNIGYFENFGCKCFVLNDRDNLGKFDAKSDEGIFLGYSSNSKAYRVFNKRTMVFDESMHVVFDEANPFYVKNAGDDEPNPLDNEASKSNQIELSEKDKEQVDEPKDEEKAFPPTDNEELPKS